MIENFEIERKYIIKNPDLNKIRKLSNRQINITQTYIGLDDKGFNCRIRKVVENGKTRFILTEKKKISNIKRIENEREISNEEYNKLFEKRLKNHNIIEKTRYCINENGFIYEIDIFSFWQKIAFLEVELENEKVVPPIPDYLSVITEVTEKKRFSNYSLSKTIPDENKILKGEF